MVKVAQPAVQSDLYKHPLPSSLFGVRRLPQGGVELSAESSILDAHDDYKHLRWLQPVYIGQRVESGLAIRSERTGVIVLYRLVGTDREAGNLYAWRFKPLGPEDVRKANGANDVIIYND